MADPVLNAGTLVWFGGYDLSSELNKVELTAMRAALANSRLPDTLECFYPGIMQVNANINGFWSAGAGSPDAVAAPRLFPALTYDASEWPLTFLPSLAPAAVAGADGNYGYNLRSAQYGVKFGAQHGESLPFYLSNKARAGMLDRMQVIAPKATRVATFTGTAYQFGAVTSGTNKVVAALHVFSVTGASGAVTVTIESDNASNFPSPITRGTFTAVATAAGVGRQVVEITSTITDDWWRAVATWTAGTNYSLGVVAGLTNA